MNNESLTLIEVVDLCSKAKLKDKSMTFESYGTGEIRNDTQRFLFSNGLTMEDAEEVVNNITVNDYFRGPTDNYDKNKKPRQMWEFKKSAFGMLLYIKVMPFNKNRFIAVISFHEDR